MHSFLKSSHTISRKGGADRMEKAKKRIRAVLVCVVLTAIFAGILYYYYNVKAGTGMAKGTLIAGVSPLRERIAAYVFR